MRGKGKLALIHADPDGITPAYAGKSLNFGDFCYRRGDHPRLCGEKQNILMILQAFIRITPAYAGKRLCMAAERNIQQDHPRLCGEKLQSTSSVIGSEGSPPPMRGKACLCITCYRNLRITPAYAGKRIHLPLPA